MKVVKGSLGLFRGSMVGICMWYKNYDHQLDKRLHNHNVGLLYVYQTLGSLVM
jgi:hypothetical protein